MFAEKSRLMPSVASPNNASEDHKKIRTRLRLTRIRPDRQFEQCLSARRNARRLPCYVAGDAVPKDSRFNTVAECSRLFMITFEPNLITRPSFTGVFYAFVAGLVKRRPSSLEVWVLQLPPPLPAISQLSFYTPIYISLSFPGVERKKESGREQKSEKRRDR